VLDKRFKDFFAKQAGRVQSMQNELKTLKDEVANDPEGKDLVHRQNEYEALIQKRDDLLHSLMSDRDTEALGRFENQRSALEDKIQAQDEYFGNHPGLARLFQILRAMPSAQGQLAELKKMLEGWDAPESLSIARQVVPAIQYWEMMMGREAPSGRQSPGLKALEGRAQGRIDLAAKTGQQVLEDLESLKSAVSELQRQGMGEKESKAMGALGQRQGTTRKSTQSLKDDMEKFSQKTPLLGHEPVEHLQAAGEAMQGAVSDKNPGSAVTDEREALYRLSQAEQKLKEAMDRVGQGMMGKGMPMPRWMGPRRGGEEGPFGAMLREVQLPSPEDYKVPKEFRQDILDAMHGPSPRGFEEQNKKYYRKLVE